MSKQYLTHIDYKWPTERLLKHFRNKFGTMDEWVPEDTVANDWGINAPITGLYVNMDEVLIDPVLREIGNDFCRYYGIDYSGGYDVFATQYMGSEPGVTIPWHADNAPTKCNVNVLLSDTNSSVAFKDHMDDDDSTATVIDYKTALLNVSRPHKVVNVENEMRILFRMIFVHEDCTYEALQEKILAKASN